jgi:hypothetical protein
MIPDPGEKPIKPEILLVKAGKPDPKMPGRSEEHSVEPSPSGSMKSIPKGVVLKEQVSLAKQDASPGITSDEISATRVQNDAPEKIPSGNVPEIPKFGEQAPAIDESTKAQAGRYAEQHGIPQGPVIAISDGREADSVKKADDTAKASGPAAGKEKETKVSLHRKAKRDSEYSTAEGEGLQQNSPGDSPAMVQTIAAAGSVPITPVVPQTVPGENPQSSSVDVEQIAASGRKAVTARGIRQGQHEQPALKQPHGPVHTEDRASEKADEAPLREGKTPAETTVNKADTGGNRPLAEDKAHVTMQAAPAVGTGGLQPQLHASSLQPPDKVAAALTAHPVHTPQSDSPVSRTIYAPGEHGTISATPTALEVGVPGGTHGWLKVRAEMGGDGGVHASMSSNSAAGTEALRRELPQLTSYLHQEQVRVSSVVVHTPHSAAEFSSQTSGDGRGQAMNGGSPDAHSGDTGRSGHGASHSQARMSQTPLGPEADGDLLPGGFGSAGGWLSVRA